MTIHHTPSINGMGAFEGLNESLLLRQKIARNAKQALHDLTDEDFRAIVSEAIRNRPAMVASDIIAAVTK